MMDLWHLVSMLTLALASSAFAASTSGVRIIDQEDIIENIVTTLCNGEKNVQLSKIDSITKLRDYFNSLPSEHEFSDCRNKNIEALDLLNSIVKLSNMNACSDEKVSLIEYFHSEYFAKGSVLAKERRKNVSQTLLVFFIQYATEVGKICRRNLIENLESDIERQFPDNPEVHLGQIKTDGPGTKHWKKFTIRNLEDIVLIWKIYENYPSLKLGLFDDTIDPATGERVLFSAKIRNSTLINEFKRKCRLYYRPIYEKSVLPVVRLSDLGFAGDKKQFKKQIKALRDKKNVERWFSAMQFCDILLPIRFFEDKSLDPKKIVFVRSKEIEDSEYPTEVIESNEKPLVYKPTTNSIAHLKQLEPVGTKNSEDLIKNIRSGQKSRMQILVKLYKIKYGIKAPDWTELKSKAASLFLPWRDHGASRASAHTGGANQNENVLKKSDKLSDGKYINLTEGATLLERHQLTKGEREELEIGELRAFYDNMIASLRKIGIAALVVAAVLLFVAIIAAQVYSIVLVALI